MNTRLRCLILVSALGSPSVQAAEAQALPPTPASAITAFMDAVAAHSESGVAQVWGTDSLGPAAAFMPAEQRSPRIRVIIRLLAHERFTINTEDSTNLTHRVYVVRVTTATCATDVAFTVVSYHGGWLVSSVALEALAPKTRQCVPGGG